ncbi:hypothetical protein EVAR_93074_1 [Eumeta japonica]|uniref:Uncharacterized protein n=1 Tax=Eumeta variegata TaxID=151549 RepID=A0A4C1TI43_EUMVA|nr:hypothetical protein EVAR_93074_1 [Eumeta japonica]
MDDLDSSIDRPPIRRRPSNICVVGVRVAVKVCDNKRVWSSKCGPDPTPMYGSEIWVLPKKNESRINAASHQSILSPPPMDIRNPRQLASALPTSWKGMRYLIEENREMMTKVTHWTKSIIES